MDEFPVLKTPADHASSFITYDCSFSGQLGCRIQGDGPTLVTLILNPETVLKIQEGKLIESVGEEEHLTQLSQYGFRPMVGDVLVAIEETSVLHLNSIEIQRYLKRQKNKVKRSIQKEYSESSGLGVAVSETMSVSSYRSVVERKVKVTFRRHFVDNVEDIVKHDEKVAKYLQERPLETPKVIQPSHITPHTPMIQILDLTVITCSLGNNFLLQAKEQRHHHQHK
jgi:hypothetical protein